MTWEIVASSLVLSLVILVPLGIKWEIPKRATIIAPASIGIIAGVVVGSIVEIYHIKLYQIFIFQFSLIVGTAGSLLLWGFYRDPERILPEDTNVILAPADGKIIYVKRIEKGIIPYSQKNGRKFFLKDFAQSDCLAAEGYLIGISMNFLNVHVNRAPIGGKVSLIRHIKGDFLSLKRKDAAVQNERALTVIDNGDFKIGVIQIASRVVRKIVLYLREGHEIQRGERMGMIRFGSQVDVILPNLPFLRIESSLGERVMAGVSILARISGEQEKG